MLATLSIGLVSICLSPLGTLAHYPSYSELSALPSSTAPHAAMGNAQERPTPTLLIEQGRSLLPAYDGEPRPSLTAEQRRDVTAAELLLAAAAELDPSNAVATWWRGHSHVLLGEDSRTRNDNKLSKRHYAQALALFDQALTLQPDDYWTFYARGMSKLQLGEPFEAIEDYTRCIDLANDVMAGTEEENSQTDALFVRFKARSWRAEARMRVFEFDEARKEFRSFYADNGNNQWNLGNSIVETYLRERNFADAQATLEAMLPIENYADFDGIYQQLGYLRGLVGDQKGAFQWLSEALMRERAPTLYPRLWLWILAPEENKAGAKNDLAAFLKHPPADLSPWDARLGAFMLGEGTENMFLTAGGREWSRRRDEGLPMDGLVCEVSFYVGLRHIWGGRASLGNQHLAKALRNTTDAFKWEWAFARLYFSERPPAPDLHALDSADYPLQGATSCRIHRAGEAKSWDGNQAAPSDRALGWGDLLLYQRVSSSGKTSAETAVVGAIQPSSDSAGGLVPRHQVLEQAKDAVMPLRPDTH